MVGDDDRRVIRCSHEWFLPVKRSQAEPTHSSEPSANT